MGEEVVGKARHYRAIHEAGHAVIARQLGVLVPRVSALSGDAIASSQSAAYLTTGSDPVTRIDAMKKDAIVALAGLAANRRERPDLPVYGLFEKNDGDMTNARSAILRMIFLRNGLSVSDNSEILEVEERMMDQMTRTYFGLVAEAAALVEEHWTAILRVAKHLESHSPIDQAALDDLIARSAIKK